MEMGTMETSEGGGIEGSGSVWPPSPALGLVYPRSSLMGRIYLKWSPLEWSTVVPSFKVIKSA